jgi:hypothetical protein
MRQRFKQTGSATVPCQLQCKVLQTHPHNFSTMGVVTGSTKVSAQFDIPTTVALGPASLIEVTNGIPSAAVAVTVN